MVSTQLLYEGFVIAVKLLYKLLYWPTICVGQIVTWVVASSLSKPDAGVGLLFAFMQLLVVMLVATQISRSINKLTMYGPVVCLSQVVSASTALVYFGVLLCAVMMAPLTTAVLHFFRVL